MLSPSYIIAKEAYIVYYLACMFIQLLIYMVTYYYLTTLNYIISHITSLVEY